MNLWYVLEWFAFSGIVAPSIGYIIQRMMHDI
jgi:hypothetical protein